MILAGIDYSLTCPAISVYNTESNNFCFDNVFSYFRSNLKRFDHFNDLNMIAENHNPNTSDEDRYDDIPNWALTILLRTHSVDKVILEGYSYGSTGKVFNIAENTAVLKYSMWNEELEFEVVPPTVIKKFATGKGNANKEKMYEAFCNENVGSDLRELLTPRSSNVISPVGDIVDSYYILKYGLSLI